MCDNPPLISVKILPKHHPLVSNPRSPQPTSASTRMSGINGSKHYMEGILSVCTRAYDCEDKSSPKDDISMSYFGSPVDESEDIWGDLGLTYEGLVLIREGKKRCKHHRRTSSLTDIIMAPPPVYQPMDLHLPSVHQIPPPYQSQPPQLFSAPIDLVHSGSLRNERDRDIEMSDVAFDFDVFTNVRNHPYRRPKARGMPFPGSFSDWTERRRNRRLDKARNDSQTRGHVEHPVQEEPTNISTMTGDYGYPHASEYVKAWYMHYDAGLQIQENAALAKVQEKKELEKTLSELGRQYRETKIRMKHLTQSRPDVKARSFNAMRSAITQRYQILTQVLQSMEQNGWDYERARLALCINWGVSSHDAAAMFPSPSPSSS